MKKKRFDCVQMKWNAQRRLEAELPGVPEAEKRRVQMARVMQDAVMGPFLKRASRVRAPSLQT